ncbi:TIGR00282 family metallophosphoesterase [Aquibaculum sediminis]|uniref:TIGR00282 family metallophosphoesterase n=1 Tax=Aquibaculum sediminis TaxID=3231907 RepID=UPI0034525EEA
MRLLFCGDLVGRSGREVVLQHLPELRRSLNLDFIVVNGENAAAGFGITRKICDDVFAAGANVISGGNHSWDQREALTFIDAEPRLLRPLNYPPGTPGRGAGVFSAGGRKVLVINVMGRVFMDPLDDPFRAVEQELSRHRLGSTVDAIIVDVHAEASSEKMAMGHFLDGRVSLVVGTHTHIPTADAQVLPGGTAYQTDAGMCGDYDSVIGMDKRVPLERFTRKLPTERMAAAQGPGTLCAVFVETDDRTGLAQRVEPLRLGGRLREQRPE